MNILKSYVDNVIIKKTKNRTYLMIFYISQNEGTIKQEIRPVSFDD